MLNQLARYYNGTCEYPTPIWTFYSCTDYENECDDEKSYYDNDAHECIESCPEAWDEGRICRKCADLNASAPFWNSATKQCVANCPAGMEPESGEMKCKTCAELYPGEKEFFDPKTQTCV